MLLTEVVSDLQDGTLPTRVHVNECKKPVQKSHHNKKMPRLNLEATETARVHVWGANMCLTQLHESGHVDLLHYMATYLENRPMGLLHHEDELDSAVPENFRELAN